MAARPTPVVMFSAHTKQGAKETFDALAAGAVDFVTKPAGEVSVDLSKVSDELTRKLIAAASAKPRPAAAPPPRPSSAGSSMSMSAIPRSTLSGGLPRLCCIAVSTGGPAALGELIPALPADLRLAIVLRVLRESGRSVSLIAFQGMYQQTPAEKPAQMLRLSLAQELPCVPEISANKYALNVRFLLPDGVQRTRVYEHDVPFELAFCNL
jgi:hypothetical protein